MSTHRFAANAVRKAIMHYMLLLQIGGMGDRDLMQQLYNSLEILGINESADKEAQQPDSQCAASVA
jgi:hypothetical protein